MELTTVLFDVADRVATITLNRPDARNAATFEMEQELIHCFAEADADPAVGCIVLTGAGKGFCAGDDVTKAWGDPRMEATLAELASPNPPITPLVGAMLATDTPTVAAVNGAAVGIGMDLALLCDLRVASEYARFAQLYVKLGLMCDVTGIWLLPQIVGRARATELLLTGEIIDATEAERIGLVSRVVGADDLMPAAYEIAAEHRRQSAARGARDQAGAPPRRGENRPTSCPTLRASSVTACRTSSRPTIITKPRPPSSSDANRISPANDDPTIDDPAVSRATSGAREVGRFEVAELVAQLVGGAEEDNFTVAEHDDPIGDVERVGCVLLDEDHADTLVGRGAHRVQEAAYDEWREAERQLVDEQQPRSGRQGTREREHLLLAARQQTGATPEQRPELREQVERHVHVARGSASGSPPC